MTDDLHELDRIKRSADAFSLTPSPAVWENVEREIRGGKRRRAFIWFLLGGALAGGAAAAWMLSGPEQDQLAVIVQSHDSAAGAISVSPDGHPSSDLRQLHVQSDASHTDLQENFSDPAFSGSTQRRSKEKSATATGVNSGTRVSLSGENPGKAEHLDRSGAVKDIQRDNLPLTKDAPAAERDRVEPSHATHTLTMDAAPARDSLPAVNDTVIALTPDDAAIELAPNDTIIPSSQNDTLPASGRFSIGVGIAPALGLSRASEQGAYQFVGKFRDSTDKELPSLNVHFDLHYRCAPWLQVYTGLRLTSYRTAIRSRQVVYRYDQGSGSGPVPPPVIVSRDYYDINGNAEGSVVNRFTYVGLPAGARLRGYQGRKLSIWLQTEAVCYAMIGSGAYTYDVNSRAYRTATRRDLRSLNFAGATGVAFHYSFKDEFGFELTPGIEGFAASVYKPDHILQQRSGQVSIRASLYYSF